MRVHAHAWACGQIETVQRAAAGGGVALRVQRFGVDAPLNRKAQHGGRCGRVETDVPQPAARRQRNLRLHQVHARDFFGDGVLDLQARIAFDEHKRQVGAGQVHQKFEGTQALVIHGARHGQRSRGDALTQCARQRGAGRDLHHFLKAPLQRAFALAQGDHLAPVAQHLHFDVAGVAHQALDVHTVHTKRGLRLAAAARVGSRQVIGRRHRAHAAPAAAPDGLDHDAGMGVLRKEGLGLFQRHGRLRAGHQRHALLLRQCAGLRLVAEQRQLRRRGADEAQPRFVAGTGEVGPLAQKAVARVHGIAALRLGDGDEARAVQVGGRAGGTQRHGRTGRLHMGAGGVVVGIHGHAGNAEVVQGAHGAQCDFAPVGNQHFGEQNRRWHGAVALFFYSCQRIFNERQRPTFHSIKQYHAAGGAAPCPRPWRAARR